MTHNGVTDFSKSGGVIEEGAPENAMHNAILGMLNELYTKDRSLRQRRAHCSKALSKGGQ